MINFKNETSKPQLSIIQDVIRNNIPPRAAAEKLASMSLSSPYALPHALNGLWYLIITLAGIFPEHQDKLVDIVVCFSKLPDEKADQGEPLRIDDEKVWKDLPYLDFLFRYELNGPMVRWDQVWISYVTNMNRFMALLMATQEPVFDYSIFALWALREALEGVPKSLERDLDPPGAHIPAAAVWIEILGVEIHDWDEEWESGPCIGARGKGGPLWKGKHGFCKERWELWRRRFGELANGTEGDEFGEEVRTTAREAEQMMKDIENGNVD